MQHTSFQSLKHIQCSTEGFTCSCHTRRAKYSGRNNSCGSDHGCPRVHPCYLEKSELRPPQSRLGQSSYCPCCGQQLDLRIELARIQISPTELLHNLLCQSPCQCKRWLRLALLATSYSLTRRTRKQALPTYFPYAPPLPGDSSVSLPTAVGHSVSQILHQVVPITSYFGTPCD
jgi:hypothetical protein